MQLRVVVVLLVVLMKEEEEVRFISLEDSIVCWGAAACEAMT